MDVFKLRDHVVNHYADYIKSFLAIRDERIREHVESELERGWLWPEPLIQLNPSFRQGMTMEDLAEEGVLHSQCSKIFRMKPDPATDLGPIRLHKHQEKAVREAAAGRNYVLTTGTGSGKSLSYIIPIVDHVLRHGSGQGIRAIVVYPMNALANSQLGELDKFLRHGFPEGHPPVTYARYTGQESQEDRQRIIESPPDILLTNYVMLELVLTRPQERKLVEAASNLRFLVLDELHTYRGRQGADVSMLVRRVRETAKAPDMLCVGTSATLASGGSWPDQQREVASVASTLFGSEVRPNSIVGETLERSTPEWTDDDSSRDSLKLEIQNRADIESFSTDQFIASALASWIETHLGLRELDGRLVRATPRPLVGANGIVGELAEITGLPKDVCSDAVQKALLRGFHLQSSKGFPIFAFRLHQFVSKGEAVYSTLEPEETRAITLQAQQYSPSHEDRHILLPMAFCRECGQEYYVVRRGKGKDGQIRYLQRELSDRIIDDDGDPGFLYVSTRDPWPESGQDVLNRVPDTWLEESRTGLRVRSSRRRRLPVEAFVSQDGVEGAGDFRVHYVPSPFLFCMSCGVEYSARQRSDFGKLATLGSEGRSTATTVLSLAAIRQLRSDESLPAKAKKLLSFTDNRQDASLQAGHFNDFVEIGLLRSAVCRAVQSAGKDGLRHDQIALAVFNELNLPLELYAANPEVEYIQREETERSLRHVLAYRLYRDLRRGWRVTSPNLEQVGLLQIDYISLTDICGDSSRWMDAHPALATASNSERETVARTLLDYMRRELAIYVDVLDPVQQESIQQRSTQYLIQPWALDEEEVLDASATLFPQSRPSAHQRARNLYLSPRGGFGQYIKRQDTFAGYGVAISTDDVQLILLDLLDRLSILGAVRRVVEPRGEGGVPGYQLNAASLLWQAGSGIPTHGDPIRVPHAPSEGHRSNPYFAEFYTSDTTDLGGLDAKEHTAQVLPTEREEREKKFREAKLPLLFCSPTMELGVDISQLNVVGLRNVPPTPANYAQRSGRAGRSGQPALVFSYCSAGSPHDQFFFRRPERMVAGAVSTPRLDLGNEDLLRAHVHALWLSHSRLSLGKSLSDVLVVEGENPSLEFKENVRDALANEVALLSSHTASVRSLGNAVQELVGDDNNPSDWIQRTLAELPHSLDRACERWRTLFRSALNQMHEQNRIIQDASRSNDERKRARRLRGEAEAQYNLLLETTENVLQSDFYSYRYFASEGFLPGYNFPRLPLSAYLPGRRTRRGHDEFLSRPRFLAITEFGPRAIIYHEGSRYSVNKVILPVETDEARLTRRAVRCDACGYIHPLGDDIAPDLCTNCGVQLPAAYQNLFRMQNVSARRRDRINSDEEERLRLGYETITGIRFPDRRGMSSKRTARFIDVAGNEIARITYGHSATLWRLNLGVRRRQDQDQLGYVLDTERGYWQADAALDDGPKDDMSPSRIRVIPYVEDSRNCLVLEPTSAIDAATIASLQAALKSAIQVYFQLEDSELATEPLPSRDNRKQILFFEASEGGAGALRQIVEDPRVLPALARQALEICHFDPDTGDDLGKSDRAQDNCVAACYDCLLSYFNQPDHRLLDRELLPEIVNPWLTGRVLTSPRAESRDQVIERLRRLTDSGLERRWLECIDSLGVKLPEKAQHLIEECSALADFYYPEYSTVIFVDGPPHDKAEQQEEDQRQQNRLEEAGYFVLRFHHASDWEEIIRNNQSIFGEPITS